VLKFALRWKRKFCKNLILPKMQFTISRQLATRVFAGRGLLAVRGLWRSSLTISNQHRQFAAVPLRYTINRRRFLATFSTPPVAADRVSQAQSLLNQADSDLENGEIDKALDKYKQSLQLNATSTAHYNIGNIYFQLGDMMEAKGNWLRSVELEGEHADVFVNLGNMELMFNNQPQEALNYYQRAEQLEPDDGEIAFNMAVAYDKLDQWDKAVETYRRAKQLLVTVEQPSESVDKRLELIEPMLRNALTKAMASREPADEETVAASANS
jgi:tetratricopeptide (TPR) repeat protein